MNTSTLPRDDSSAVNVYGLVSSKHRISLRCSPVFAQRLSSMVSQQADGFGGVEFSESGRGWYQLNARRVLSNEETSSSVDRELFIQYALAALHEMMSSVPNLVLVTSSVQHFGVLAERKLLKVQGQLSSNPIRPALSDRAWRRLEEFSRSKRNAKPSRAQPGR